MQKVPTSPTIYADGSICHFKFPKVMLAHILGKVGTFCTVILSVPSGHADHIFIEISLYLSNTEQNNKLARLFLRHGVAYYMHWCNLYNYTQTNKICLPIMKNINKYYFTSLGEYMKLSQASITSPTTTHIQTLLQYIRLNTSTYS